MNDSTFPEGVGLQFFDIPYWHEEGANFALHKEEYNNETLARVDAMAALYPQASGVFALLKEELDGNLPSGVIDEDDRSGGYIYEKATKYGLGHQNLFRILQHFHQVRSNIDYCVISYLHQI